MGADNSKRLPTESEDQIKIAHQKFTNIKYLPIEDQVQISIEVASESDIQKWQNDLKRLDKCSDKQSLLLPIKSSYKSKGFCGNTGLLTINYQNFPHLLVEEIENRIHMQKHFEEEEIWYLLYSLVAAARDFSKVDSKIGDVRPFNIFLNEDGMIKIANIYSWPNEKTNFDKTAFQKQITYLSPEEINLISKGNLDNTTNKVLSESFSIGLTILESILLFNPYELYSTNGNSFNHEKLKKMINELQTIQFQGEDGQYESYGPLLKAMVTSLCEIDWNKRKSSLQIEQLLRPYQNEIVNLKQFDQSTINFLPKNTNPNDQRLNRGRPYQENRIQFIPNNQDMVIQNIQQPQQIRTNRLQPISQQEYFQRYAEPNRINMQIPLNQEPVVNHRQQFQRYAATDSRPTYLMQNQQPQQIPFQYRPVNTFQYSNTMNVPNIVYDNSVITSANFPYPINNANVPPSFQPMPPPSTDFLKRIDVQLQNSRRQFPS